MTVNIKNLCQEFKIDAYPLRKKLRERLPERDKGQHWKWPNTNHPEYKIAREVAKGMSKDADS